MEVAVPNFIHRGVPEAWEVTGRDLLAQGVVRRELGGVGLFVAFERVSDAPLPRRLEGSFRVLPGASRSCVYIRARQWDGHEAWSSPLFFSASGDGVSC